MNSIELGIFVFFGAFLGFGMYFVWFLENFQDTMLEILNVLKDRQSK